MALSLIWWRFFDSGLQASAKFTARKLISDPLHGKKKAISCIYATTRKRLWLHWMSSRMWTKEIGFFECKWEHIQASRLSIAFAFSWLYSWQVLVVYYQCGDVVQHSSYITCTRQNHSSWFLFLLWLFPSLLATLFNLLCMQLWNMKCEMSQSISVAAGSESLILCASKKKLDIIQTPLLQIQ